MWHNPFCQPPIGQNLVTWLNLTAKKAGKYSLPVLLREEHIGGFGNHITLSLPQLHLSKKCKNIFIFAFKKLSIAKL